MHPETQVALQHARAAELRADADAYRLAAVARHRRGLRARLGWALAAVGLRLTAAPKTAAAVPASRAAAPPPTAKAPTAPSATSSS
ncbi:hypothetical protein ACLQ18_40560 [Streptomyces sp. DT193]|uniref:hypothetical protein n=1 Tax=Streptomyces sp. DT193 TaxID=3393418 RepID=UPI003CF901BB